jgi:hypothetical protein
MPRVYDTRKQRAVQLLLRLREGPAFGFGNKPMTRKQAEQEYRLWSQSWMILELISLVPELRRLHKLGRLNNKGEIQHTPSGIIRDDKKKTTQAGQH